MLRRDFLITAAAFPWMGKSFSKVKSFGYLPFYHKPDQKTKHLTNFGKEKVALLWKAWEKVIGKKWISTKQLHYDCVAVAAGSGMDLLTTVRVARGKKEKWITYSSTDAIYSGGRNNIPHVYISRGMRGIWAIKYLSDYGNLLRKKYGDVDLTPYTEESCIELNCGPLPEQLLLEAKKHPLLDYSSLMTWKKIRDAVAAGFPVIYCSNLGVENSVRDKDGFIEPEGEWAHAWLIAGVDDENRPGACLLNSHGSDWASGPKRHDQPDGSVWVDAKYIEKHLYEAYALSDYQGFPKPEQKYVLW